MDTTYLLCSDSTSGNLVQQFWIIVPKCIASFFFGTGNQTCNLELANLYPNPTSHPLFLKTRSLYVVQVDLKLVAILLPPPPECWDYRSGPPCPAASLLRIKKRYNNSKLIGDKSNCKNSTGQNSARP